MTTCLGQTSLVGLLGDFADWDINRQLDADSTPAALYNDSMDEHGGPITWYAATVDDYNDDGSLTPGLFENGHWIGFAGSMLYRDAETYHTPIAADDVYATNEDVVLKVASPGVLSNDTDVDGDSLTAMLVTGPSHGSLAFIRTRARSPISRPRIITGRIASPTRLMTDGMVERGHRDDHRESGQRCARPCPRRLYDGSQWRRNAVLTIAAPRRAMERHDVDSGSLSTVW